MLAPTVGAFALRALRRHPDRVAFEDGGSTMTYGAALDLIGRFQRVYADHGLRQGARMALLSSNRADVWCAATAAQASGIAITWLHPLASLEDQQFQLGDVEADALVVDELRFGERGEALEGPATAFSLGPSSFGIDLSAETERAGATTPSDVADPDALAVVNYTGGTTGRPKGAARRHGAAQAMTVAILADFELPATPRYLAVAPNSHVGGTLVPPVLARGGTVHLLPGFSPDAVIEHVRRHAITMTLLVPTMIYALLDEPRFGGDATASLELLLYGAAPMSPERLAEGMERLGPVFGQLYGQSECYPISYLPRADHVPELQGSCGVPSSLCSVRILDDEGADVDVGEAGEIAVRGAAAMEGYLNHPDPAEDGWIRTGDVARMDERGYLFIQDRKKDMIISGGFNVYPREVEDALTAHPDVAEAAVFGVPDDRWGEAVTAAVVLRAGATADAAALTDHVKARKGSLQTPKQVHVVAELPRTAIGKIDKKRLRQQVSDGGA
jgi:fatty-acyl-CoA synthase